jgi:hypothetical protein
VLDVTGPLGKAFPLPRDPVNCLLIGGGYGSAPLFSLAGKLKERRCEVDFLLGAGSGDRVFGALTARRTGRTAIITTEDGSLGSRGMVTDMLDQAIHDGRTDVIYACGPMPMLRQITVLARRYDIPVQAAVEEAMACGIGVCMTCVLPVIGSDGITRMSRACMDGPVFRGESVRWDEAGTIPFDAFGAPGWEPRSRRAAELRNGQARGGDLRGGDNRGGDTRAGRTGAGRAQPGGEPDRSQADRRDAEGGGADGGRADSGDLDGSHADRGHPAGGRADRGHAARGHAEHGHADRDMADQGLTDRGDAADGAAAGRHGHGR